MEDEPRLRLAQERVVIADLEQVIRDHWSEIAHLTRERDDLLAENQRLRNSPPPNKE